MWQVKDFKYVFLMFTATRESNENVNTFITFRVQRECVVQTNVLTHMEREKIVVSDNSNYKHKSDLESQDSVPICYTCTKYFG